MKRLTAFLSILSIAASSFAQLHIVKEGLPGVPAGGIEFKGLLYFPLYADARFFDADLWKSDGTAAGTVLVKDFSTVHGIGERAVWNGELFFLRTDELWKTDGTETGTLLLKSFDSNITVWYLVAGGDEVYFQTISETGEKNELWKSDGTVSGTVKVVDIQPLMANEVPSFTYANGFLFFWSTTADHGSELWRSDGTAGGTVMVKDIYPGPQSSYYNRYDFYYPSLTSMGNKVYFFAANNSVTGFDLWVSDGTTGGTVLVKDLAPGIDSPSQLTAVGNNLFFSSTDEINGEELWKSDGTPQGTVMLKDITPGAIGSYPALLTAVNDELYFIAGDGYRLWKSDGTAAGTLMVADAYPWGHGFTGINGMVFFAARAELTGVELWASDGTAGGTYLAQDIRPGELSSFPRNMTAVGNNLFFTANNGHGETLWVNETSPEETSDFTLINALTDTDIGPIKDGDVINLAALPTKKLNIRFETEMVSGSVTFTRNGRHVRTENDAPYAMAGDEPTGNYSIWTPAVGQYEVCATPHSGYGGRGVAGVTECITFTVVRNSTNKLSEDDLTQTVPETDVLQLYPNPNEGVFNVAFSIAETSNVRVEIFDMFGKTMFREELLSFSGAYLRHFDLSGYPQGVYLLRVDDGIATSVRKVVISE